MLCLLPDFLNKIHEAEGVKVPDHLALPDVYYRVLHAEKVTELADLTLEDFEVCLKSLNKYEKSLSPNINHIVKVLKSFPPTVVNSSKKRRIL